MSAYLVAPEQISEMVKWAVSRRHKCYYYNLFTKKEIDTDPENLVKILAKANVDSINARYNEQDNSADFVADCLAELNTEIANVFIDSKDRKVNSVHVEKAMLNLILSRNDEEGEE